MDKDQIRTHNKKVLILATVFGLTIFLRNFISSDRSFIMSHLSNFGFTGLLLTSSLFIIGKYSPKKAKRDFTQALVVCIALNIILEFSDSVGDLQLPFGITFQSFNTADPIDAVFGFVAIIAVLLTGKYWINYAKKS